MVLDLKSLAFSINFGGQRIQDQPYLILDFNIFFKSELLRRDEYWQAEPSVFQPSKMFGFDLETYLTGMTVSGNLELEGLA